MIPIILLLSSPLIILLYVLLHKPNQSPPGPRGLPLIGSLHQLAASKAPHVYLWQLSQRHGPMVQVKLGSVPVIVISSAKLANEMMRQDIAFCGRPALRGPRVLTYSCMDIVFSPYGDHWRELRKITSLHLFSLKKTQSFRPIREEEVSRVVANISSLRVVDLRETAMALGSAMISRVAFGKSKSETRRFDGLLRETQAMLAGFYVSDYFPAMGWVDKLSGVTGRLESVFNKLDSFYEEVIEEHVANKAAGVAIEGHILDVLIQLKQDKTASSIDLTWDIVKALLTDIFVAATDTSAASIVWTMTALIKAPHVMHKVQAEVRALIGNKGTVDEDDLPKLPYLKAVINETFRLYPPAPLLVPRQTTQKCTLQGYEIQPNTVVYVNAWAIGRDPVYWEDSLHEFLPERFLNNNIDVKGNAFGLVPFGWGRRICPGMLMGLANVELTLANLLYSFDWRLPHGIEAEDIDLDVLPGLTMHKKNALVLVPITKKHVASSV